MEIAQLKDEINRIAETTRFNDVVYPLNAPITDKETSTEMIGVSSKCHWTNGLIYETSFTIITDQECTYDGKKYNVGDEITINGLTTNNNEIWVYAGVTWARNGWKWSWSDDYDNMKSLTICDLRTDKNGYLYYDWEGTKKYAVYFQKYHQDKNYTDDPIYFHEYDHALNDVQNGVAQARFMTVADLGIRNSATPEVQTGKNDYFNNGMNIYIQAGATSSQADKIPIRTVNATCKGLGILDVTLVTEDSSTRSLDRLDKAIIKASSYRSMFGATQNRLEHAKKIDDNTVENTQAAESLIRDTDMADEMVRNTNANILAQAGQAMLSQANLSNQRVLSLIA
ncbi:MAG: hypothetical protein K2N89_04965 [Lachnospiraceae bacterium]|nr:hypothetical protein [Lachnospiraceae bacterium]